MLKYSQRNSKIENLLDQKTDFNLTLKMVNNLQDLGEKSIISGQNSIQNSGQKIVKKSQKKEIDYVSVRSFLGSNVDILLENLAARRENSKNNSEDIFATHVSPSIKWKKNQIPKTKLQILIEEKNALGLYMSGNPLVDYIEIEKILQEKLNKWNFRLMFINKVRKIFTKAGQMMFALEINLVDREIEAVIFPKNAMELSPRLAENELYLVIGNVQEKRKKKTETKIEEIIEPSEIVKSVEDEDENLETEIVESPVIVPEKDAYEEKPKFLIETLVKYTQGTTALLEHYLAVDWNLLVTDLPQFIDQIKNQNQSSYTNLDSNFDNSQNKNVKNLDTKNSPKKIILSEKLGNFALQIKKNLSKEKIENYLECELYLVKNEQNQKVKGQFWIPDFIWQNYQSLQSIHFLQK